MVKICQSRSRIQDICKIANNGYVIDFASKSVISRGINILFILRAMWHAMNIHKLTLKLRKAKKATTIYISIDVHSRKRRCKPEK